MSANANPTNIKSLFSSLAQGSDRLTPEERFRRLVGGFTPERLAGAILRPAAI